MKESREELQIIALTRRIGELVSSYEHQLAEFRADATLAVDNLNARVEELEDELKSYKSQGENDKASE